MTQQEREIAETLATLIAKAETGEQWAEICRLEAEMIGGPWFNGRNEKCQPQT